MIDSLANSLCLSVKIDSCGDVFVRICAYPRDRKLTKLQQIYIMIQAVNKNEKLEHQIYKVERSCSDR